MYEQKNITVIRLGLQPTETINTGMDVVAGPFHPAFRQLVEAKCYQKRIEEIIIQNELTEEKSIVIYTNAENVSNVTGHKKENLNYFISKYGYTGIKIIVDAQTGNNLEISAGF
jgi:hypothetical protein